MKNSPLEDQYCDFLHGPSVAKLMAARKLVLQHDDYQPYAPFWSRLASEFNHHRFEEVVGTCVRYQQVGCLSPRFHFYWGIASGELGDLEQSDNRDIVNCCGAGILI